MNIRKNTFVTLAQRVTDPGGQILDDGGEPLRYLHGGYGGIFAKLEDALAGKGVGDTVRATLAPADAHGEHDPDLVIGVPLASFQAPPVIGDIVERDFAGATLLYRVVAVDDDTAKLDGNHPWAGMTLVFSATVTEVRPATDAEVAAGVAAQEQAAHHLLKTKNARARADKAAKAEREAAALAKAEAEDLVESTYVPQLGMRIRFVFRSQTHKLCWLAPLFLLPIPGVFLGIRGHEDAAVAVALVCILWCFLSPTLIGWAIDRWGYRFLFFDFSPNLTPSPLESRIVTGGQVLSVLVVLVYTVVALFHIEHFSDLLALVGLDLFVLFVASIPLMILLPFLVMVVTAFRVRPVIDKTVSAAKQG
ncbi:hypothetical protein A6A04_04090 [Paramagnetospirillum marisnigri]|uniref:peptidylprolyl isomerase n=1 Tax=Paramagnetospirillum marisnigri TaxID=1285242 RepID=A0A178MKP1_9PROT|nr:peptidylprolyl isomerase [Paramagnetospirillum marisnigri]OAN49302.1 hypothetical protein A6A04_04090 [Paramagnetospirillum marisnigri]